ncbi:ATP-binding protein [Streptomyces reniochalinae]|uniref:NB-ARC domain-containing protein n=1 Tax=Streptomyces reniochalinae TaxID=2250578 RepID=A0A367ELX2_9ACTN|nr:hypothetical protein [Streptomyces reniochalinae]RCG18387.1 hypothetical protein DQ392_13630 [Streptomyces reniochalinae]
MSEQTHNTVDGQVSAGAVVQAASIGAVHHHTYAAPEEPAAPPVQLPVESAHFADRDDERAGVARALGRRRAAAAAEGATSEVVRPLVVAVSGIGGAGKTALGLRLAHEAHRERGCGALYVDLDDYRREGGVSPSDVLAVLLRGLGVHEPWLAKDLAGRHRQYAQRTWGRELVVVLDNVAYASEAEPLLPVSASAVAVVISRKRLEGLTGALEVPLGPLPGSAAEGLLHTLVDGAGPAGGRPEVVAEIARMCGGLPAALHVAGRYLRTHRRRPPERLVAALRTELDEEGLPVVEAVWDAAYRELTAPAARLYRLLAAHPGPSFTAASAVALLGAEDIDTGYDALGELEDARLVALWEGGDERDGAVPHAAERLRMHDLLRAHAQRCARRDGRPGEVAAAHRRVVRWYRRQAERADALVAGGRMRFADPVPPLPYAPDVPLGDKAEAARWMAAEHPALHACVHLAHEVGDPEADADAWGLCEPLWTHYMDHRHHAEAIDAFGAGLASAQRTENLAAQARMRCQLARALWESGQLAQARVEIDHAVRAAAGLRAEPKLRASTLEFRGLLHREEGDTAAAVEEFTASRRIHEQIGNAYGVLLLGYLLGKTLTDHGAPQRAAELLETAHREALAQDRERMTGLTAYELARALQQAAGASGGDLTDPTDLTDLAGGSGGDSIRSLYERALASARTRGADHDEAKALHALADLAEETHQPETAADRRAAARAIETRAGARVLRS